jgi:lipoprotein-releasing system permease protein
MEQEQKKRLLGFSPHILLQQVGSGEQTAAIQGWPATIDSLKSLPHVVSAYPHIEDNAVVDSMTFQRPITYQAVETEDEKQVDGITKILDLTNFPSSTADMGLDARVVVSSLIAEQFSWSIGDKINLYSTRNFEQVFDAYKSTEQPIVRERFPSKISAIRELLEKQWIEDANGYLMKRAEMNVLNALYAISSADSLRSSEASAINNAWFVVAEAEHDTTNDTFRFAAGSKEQFTQALRPILEDEQDKLDSEALKELKDVVLPREVEIVGVFQSSMMLKMPDIFMPLSLAQGLSGLGDGVQGIALKVEDPYRLANVLPSLMENLPPGWYLSTWEEQFESFFNIINQQRVIMYFVLSFII